jgi:hypothetical protein
VAQKAGTEFFNCCAPACGELPAKWPLILTPLLMAARPMKQASARMNNPATRKPGTRTQGTSGHEFWRPVANFPWKMAQTATSHFWRPVAAVQNSCHSITQVASTGSFARQSGSLVAQPSIVDVQGIEERYAGTQQEVHRHLPRSNGRAPMKCTVTYRVLTGSVQEVHRHLPRSNGPAARKFTVTNRVLTGCHLPVTPWIAAHQRRAIGYRSKPRSALDQRSAFHDGLGHEQNPRE